MAEKTTNLGLTKPGEEDLLDVDVINENYDLLDAEVAKRAETVNGNAPDGNGNVQLNEVPFARQIVTDDTQQSSGEYVFRTTGGDASLQDGDAKLVAVYGRMLHEGHANESITMEVNMTTRETGEEEIEARLDRDTFVAYVHSSGTTALLYTDAWSANPSLYGVTVTGTPLAGDRITIEYVKEERGTITVSNPTEFVSTGWNLYDSVAGYAHVKRYSENYGFIVGGTYTAIRYSATLNGTKTVLTPVNGHFNVPGDGYVWVTGGSAADTYIMMTWSDWTNGYEGEFQPYTESVIDMNAVMENFPYGLMQVGSIVDEINLDMGVATSRIDRMDYTAQNLAMAKASGRGYVCDENYIYIVRAEAETYDVSVDGTYMAYDHGLEIVRGGTVAPYIQTIYGNNLVDKLRTDVLTISAQTLSEAQQKQARANIGAPRKMLKVSLGTVSALPITVTNESINAEMECVNAEFGTPSAQIGDWTVTTSNGSVTVSGTINGSTSLTVWLDETET